MTAPVDHFLLSREWIAVRMIVLERDGGRCACCGRAANDGVRINVDHKKPRSRYPELALTASNLQVLCSECNQGKGNRFETDWLTRLAPRQPTGTPAEEAERERQLNIVRASLRAGSESHA